jgi:dUTP pyrophosphatase
MWLILGKVTIKSNHRKVFPMKISPIRNSFIMPTKGTNKAGAFDIYMPEAGYATAFSALIGLGFAAAVPDGHVALLLPRSGTGAKFGLELNNTCGVIDSDYRGEWKAALRTKSGDVFHWEAGDRVLQFLVVPIAQVELELVDSLDDTDRGAGGFGSSGK